MLNYNFYHSLLKQVVSDEVKVMGPCGSTTLPLTTCYMGQIF